MMKTQLLPFLLCLVTWELWAQQPFVNVSNVVQPDPAVVNTATDDFVFGSTSLNAGISSTFSRFFFDKDLGAFRAGNASAGFWDTPQIGEFSFGWGFNTTASGYASFAGGSSSLAAGAYSFAFGAGAQATGDRSISLGELAVANGSYGMALGHSAEASGTESVSIGFATRATGLRSVALGGNATANGAESVALNQSTSDGEWSLSAGLGHALGDYSVSFGTNSIASGFASLAHGETVSAIGDQSVVFGTSNVTNGLNSLASGLANQTHGMNTVVFGTQNTADFDHETVLGLFNDPTDYGGSQNIPLLVVGNGTTVSNRDNALAVLQNGDVVIPDLPQDLAQDPTAVQSVVVDPDGRLRVSPTGMVNTDHQQLGFDPATLQLSISNGNTVTLTDTDQQLLTFDPVTSLLSISNGNSVTLPATASGGSYQGGMGIGINGGSINARVVNGLRVEGSDNTIRLGGPLIENTTVDMKGYTMAFDGEGDFVVGDYQVDQTLTGNNTKMFFETFSGAFRSGVVSGTAWNTSNLGGASFGFGQDAIAAGHFSFAGGHTTVAKSDYSFAFGHLSNATALGSIAVGYRNESNGQVAMAMGNGNTANGHSSASIGNANVTDGVASMAFGNQNKAKGDGSFTAGLQNTTLGSTSVALGQGTMAHSLGEVALGLYNTTYTPGSTLPYVWNSTDRILVIGRGTSPASRMDALTVFKNGNATLAGNLSQSSDERLKTHIEPIERASEQLDRIEGYTYEWTRESHRAEGRQYGVIAQEIREVFPELVTVDAEGYYSVNYSGLVPVLIAAFKEEKARMSAELEALKSQIETLKGESDSTTGNRTFPGPGEAVGKVTLYPNPAQDEVTVSGIEGPFDLDILTLQGQLIRHESGHQGTIDLTGLARQTYLLRITAGDQCYPFKMVLK